MLIDPELIPIACVLLEMEPEFRVGAAEILGRTIGNGPQNKGKINIDLAEKDASYYARTVLDRHGNLFYEQVMTGESSRLGWRKLEKHHVRRPEPHPASESHA